MVNDSQTGSRVPVVVYVCTAEDDAADLIAEHVQQYAHARDWPVVETVRDHDRLQPLDQRPGWARVLELTPDRARGIVTFSPPMLTADIAAFEALRRKVADQGHFLVATRTSGVRPRRTAADAARRRDLAAAASGWLLDAPHA
ncbi:hypothetical protein [Streptomyces spongiicola]|uniref:hypothetical protein n=1 Tax=Streptomyces spongiicola TaxID=1690221 RepID=UPI0013A575E8|nr:hypothetical protein [Streptomyces spongiicola]